MKQTKCLYNDKEKAARKLDKDYKTTECENLAAQTTTTTTKKQRINESEHSERAG